MAEQNTGVYGVPNPQPHVVSMEQERRLLDAWMTKVARSKRKMARQRSLSLTKNSAGSSSSTHADPRGLIVSGTDTFLQNSNNNARHSNLYSFCTPDKKVGNLGFSQIMFFFFFFNSLALINICYLFSF